MNREELSKGVTLRLNCMGFPSILGDEDTQTLIDYIQSNTPAPVESKFEDRFTLTESKPNDKIFPHYTPPAIDGKSMKELQERCIESNESILCHESIDMDDLREVIESIIQETLKSMNAVEPNVSEALEEIEIKTNELNDIFNKQGDWQVSIDVVHGWLYRLESLLKGGGV